MLLGSGCDQSLITMTGFDNRAFFCYSKSSRLYMKGSRHIQQIEIFVSLAQITDAVDPVVKQLHSAWVSFWLGIARVGQSSSCAFILA